MVSPAVHEEYGEQFEVRPSHVGVNDDAFIVPHGDAALLMVTLVVTGVRPTAFVAVTCTVNVPVFRNCGVNVERVVTVFESNVPAGALTRAH
jgi:hypothetical protein